MTDPQRSPGGQRSPDATSTVFEVLAHERRRYALHCLREHPNPMTLADLADEVASRENGTPLSEVPAETVKRVYLSLYHEHVPKLADEGFAEYDQEEDAVALLDRADQVGLAQQSPGAD